MALKTEPHICDMGMCRLCRRLESGRSWRAIYWREFFPGAGGPDFPCPRSLPWREGAPAEKRQPARGLGDDIAALTHAVGLKPCRGCHERRAALNRLPSVVRWLGLDGQGSIEPGRGA